MQANFKDQENQRKQMLINQEIYQIKINNSCFYNQLGKYDSIMALFSLIGFNRSVKQISTSFNFLMDPESKAEQNRVWHQFNTGSVMPSRTNTGSTTEGLVSHRTIMKKMQHDNMSKQQSKETKDSAFEGIGAERKLASTVVYLEISKVDYHVINTVKEAYLELKEIVGCCD